MKNIYRQIVLAIIVCMQIDSACAHDLYTPPSVELKESVDENGNEVIRLEAIKTNVKSYDADRSCFKTTSDKAEYEDHAIHVTEVGKPSITSKAYSVNRPGLADAVSAFRLISPPGWNGKKLGKPDLNVVLKWVANDNWVISLESALKGTNIKAKVDWDRKTISFSDISYMDLE